MEKVELTREQAEAIKYALSDNEDCYNGDKDRLIRDVIKPNVRFHSSLSPLNQIDIALFSRALYTGYEVEPEYKVGDWVHVEVPKEKLPNVYQIMNADRYSVNLDRLYGNHKKSDIRHATPEEIAEEKERRWWTKHDRGVWEVREGDLISYKRSRYVREIVGIQNNEYITDRNFTSFTKDELKEYFVIANFKEDRKDG